MIRKLLTKPIVKPLIIPCFGVRLFPILVLGLFVVLDTHVVFAQAQYSQLSDDPKGLFGQPPSITKETPPSREAPASPELLPPVPSVEERQTTLPPLKVFIKEVRIVGSTVFSGDELAAVISQYTDRELTSEEIGELRQAVTDLYIKEGFITSGAVLPDQDVQEGVLTLRIIEGELADIQIAGLEQFRPWYFTSRLGLTGSSPVNLNELRDRMQLFLQDERINRINAEIQPGSALGQSVLKVNVEESSPWRAWAEFNNFQSPTVGAERGIGTLAYLNPLGLGDSLSASYGRSEGVNPLVDVRYSIPFTPWDTTFTGQYRRNDFTVVESTFKPLDIESETEVVTLSLRQPVFRTPTQEIALTLIGEYQQNKNFLLGIPFAFTPGTTEKGEVNISALRFAQEWVHRRPNQVIAALSRFSFGLNVLGATTTSSGSIPDGRFFAWLGQVQGAHRLDPWGIQFIGRMDFQWSNDPLFPLEQYPMGGRYTVRGYRENTLVRDNAFLFSIESRVPLVPSFFGEDTVQLAPFIDVGRSWNHNRETPSPQTLASVGMGLWVNVRQTQMRMFPNAQFNIYWGQQLNHVPDRNKNLQDHGIHLQLIVEVL